MANDGTLMSDSLEAFNLVSGVLEPLTDDEADNFQVARLSWHRNLVAWLYVPVGILIMLLACFGVNSLIGLSSVSFPASVALLVALFFALILCDLAIGNRRTNAFVKLIDVPV
jgi:hypothetical protein